MSSPYFEITDQLLRNGSLEEAIANYHKAIEDNPNSSWLYQNLAEALTETGRSVASYCCLSEGNRTEFYFSLVL
ncbi:MAG: tetratricopeptide repeat protein [Planktothrix sp. GU0601_MAG3]|nr:MAG: tetratricopeptide repeat protein [Planktothrix sp. GU0601_MAG3]